MRKTALLIIMTCVVSAQVIAQCAICNIDQSCTMSPAEPIICPDSLQNDTVNQPYEDTFTFYLPANFTDAGSGQNVDFNQMDVISVTQMPPGMTWSAYDYQGNNTTTFYPDSDPSGGSERGCAKICGTPLVPGQYQIKIEVVVQVYATSVGISVTQNQTFYMPLEIYPDGGNTVFTMSNNIGCDSVTTSFSPIIASGGDPLYEYIYDFGGGNIDSNEITSYTFTATGAYPIIGTTNIYEYVLEYVDYQVNDDGLWCGDIEEPSIFGACTGSPDIFFNLFNGSGLQVYTSSVGSNSTSNSWSGLNIVVDDPPYSFTFWDEDNISQNDNLGSTPFNITGTGSFNASSSQSIANWTIGKQIAVSYTDTDTVYVYGPPTIGNILTNGDSVCDGDSVMLSIDAGYTYQWFDDTTMAVGGNDSVFSAKQSGNYWVQVTELSTGCSAASDTQTVVVVPLMPKPGIINFGNGTLQTFAVGGALQWYYNGSPLLGETNSQLTVPANGYYQVTIANELGCTTISDSIYIELVGVGDIWSVNNLKVYPNPVNNVLNIHFQTTNSESVTVSLIDVTGRVVHKGYSQEITGVYSQQIELGELEDGIYIVQLNIGGRSLNHRVIKQ